MLVVGPDKENNKIISSGQKFVLSCSIYSENNQRDRKIESAINVNSDMITPSPAFTVADNCARAVLAAVCSQLK